mmetsp:Transcript_33335/g.110229  ORF Transcript_33335/g.110229 Transcript_33335/m.110229 type:complete len:224 (+) Transcript_33335:161-832(+)
MADAPQTHGFQNHPTLTTRHNRPVQQSGPGPAPLRDHDSSSARPVYRQLIGAAPGGQAPRAPDLRHREGGRGGGGAAGRKANSRLVPVIIIVRLPRSALDKVASRARHLDRLKLVRLCVARDLKLERLALRERAEALGLDVGLVHKQVLFLVLNVDEAKALLHVKPLALADSRVSLLHRHRRAASARDHGARSRAGGLQDQARNLAGGREQQSDRGTRRWQHF